ncbi:hypothetical protein BGZ97_002330 [Linnemannia gamsii]|uniref:DUF7707 domain-containing protein n=1 Tax=Linnemannia gamsii TaxID=64522 RepID=A0A9P6UHE1_9FUNG|nr:hypothetical protein BGZ97_002330 [Linnemannia gamsii]
MISFIGSRAFAVLALLATLACVSAFDRAQTLDNRCDVQTLLFTCECQGGTIPNITEYTYTIPYFECVADVQKCIKDCPQGDNGCYTNCNGRNCTAEFPKKYNQTIATSIVATPTAGPGSPQITGLPPGIFGNSGNMNRGVQTWTALGGSSVLGLVVFLTVGVLFGNQME